MLPPVLGSLGLRIRRHWLEHRPKMAKALQAEGRLDRAVYAAEQLTLAAHARAIQQGLTPDQARELTQQEWAFLPDEEDVPELGRDPRTWSAPAGHLRAADELGEERDQGPQFPRGASQRPLKHPAPGFGKRVGQLFVDRLNENLRAEGKIK